MSNPQSRQCPEINDDGSVIHRGQKDSLFTWPQTNPTLADTLPRVLDPAVSEKERGGDEVLIGCSKRSCCHYTIRGLMEELLVPILLYGARLVRHAVIKVSGIVLFWLTPVPPGRRGSHLTQL